MGIAASQARFLQCTARKSNVEYQGQQINQERTVLSNKSAAAYSQMLALTVPTPPSQANFTKMYYNVEIGGNQIELTESEAADIKAIFKDSSKTELVGTGASSSYKKGVTGQTITIGGTSYSFAIRVDSTDTTFYPNSINKTTDRLASVFLGDFETQDMPSKYDSQYNNGAVYFKVSESIDQAAYDDAYNQYKYDQYVYEKELEDINAQTSLLHQQDQMLELQLKQLDTEQSALKTELEALDKVIGDDIESDYKTFGG